MAALDLDRVGVSRGDTDVAGSVLVELDADEAVYLEAHDMRFVSGVGRAQPYKAAGSEP